MGRGIAARGRFYEGKTSGVLVVQVRHIGAVSREVSQSAKPKTPVTRLVPASLFVRFAQIPPRQFQARDLSGPLTSRLQKLTPSLTTSRPFHAQ
jgi:hypothetical protein